MLSRISNLFKIKYYILFMICMMLMGIGIAITVPFLSLFSTEELGMSTGAYGVLIGISSLGGVLVNSLIAKRSDNGMDRKWLIILSLIASIFNYLCYMFFHQYIVLLITVTITSGIGALCMPQIFAYAQESMNKSGTDDIIFAMSTLRSLFSLGFLIGPLFGTVILHHFDYNGLFLGTGAIFLAMALIVFFALGKSNAGTVQKKSNDDTESGRYSLKSKIIALPFTAFILFFTISNIDTINTPLLIVNILDGTRADIGYVASLSAGLEIPIMIILGAMGRRISNLYLMIGACFIGLVYHILLTLSSASWQIIVGQVFQAVFVAIVMGNGLSYFAEILPFSPGIAATIYANSNTLGRLVGTMGGGFLSDLMGYRFVNLACVAFLVISFSILWMTKRHKENGGNRMGTTKVA